MIAVFETATLADAVQRAARIAPTKGAAWDKAAGIVIEYDVMDSTHHVAVQATDLETTFTRRVPVVDITDAANEVTWRLPSALLNGVLTGLPMGHGHTVTISDTDEKGIVKIKADKAVSKLRTIDVPFPHIERFDVSSLAPVADFADRLAQVAWCVDTAITAPLCGVHIDGESLVACDRIRAVFVPCKVPVEEPITASLAQLSDVLKNAEEVSLRAEDARLLVSPDRDTETTTTIYKAPYPNVRGLMRTDFSDVVTIGRAALDTAINRMMVLVKGDRYPTIKLGFSNGSIGIVAEDPEVGRMQDEIECVGGPANTLVVSFTPQALMGAVNGSGADRIELGIGPTNMKAVGVTAGDYKAVVMPKAPGAAA